MIQLQSNKNDRVVGIILLVTAILTVVTMAHHPTGHGGMLGALVHGAMIAWLSLSMFGLAYFCLRRGLGHPVILAALIAYFLNYFAHVIAATINGFIVPALAAHGEDIPHALFLMAWESNQAFARLGTAATAVAFALLGFDIIRREVGYYRIIGGLGVLAGVAPILLLIDDATMDVRSALIIYGLHSGFLALLGVQMIQRKASHSAE